MPRRAYIASLASGPAGTSRGPYWQTGDWLGSPRRSPAPAHSINGPPPITYRSHVLPQHALLFQTNLLQTSSLGL